MNKNQSLMGINLTKATFKEILDSMNNNIQGDRINENIGITNTETLYHSNNEIWIKNYVNDCEFSCCDGIGLSIASLFWGGWIERRNGPELMTRACDYGQKNDWKHYFYGGKEGVNSLLESRLVNKFPDLKIVGKYTPPFRELNESEVDFLINDIKYKKPDIIWVGLGLPKQEKFIVNIRNKLKLMNVNVPYMIGVGASFDYHAGTVRWAPKWIRRIGMEWLFRIIIQPKLRLKRYYWSFQIFFIAVYKGLINNFIK